MSDTRSMTVLFKIFVLVAVIGVIWLMIMLEVKVLIYDVGDIAGHYDGADGDCAGYKIMV